MRVLCANFINELEKLSARRKYFFLLIYGLMICIMSVSANLIIVRNTYGSVLEAAAGVPSSMLYVAMLMFVPIMVFVAAADMFSREAYDGTLRILLVRPISRMKIYISKTAALFVLSAVFLAAMLVSAMLMELILVHTVSGTLASLASYAVDLAPLLTVVLFAAMICQLSSRAGFSIFLCIVIGIGTYAVQIFVPAAENFLFTKYLVWHNMWYGGSSPLSLAAACAVLLIYNAVFFTAGYLKFRKLEV